MNPILDPAVFRWNPLPPPAYFNETEFFHIRSRRSYRMRSLQVDPEHGMLQSECLCEVQLLRGAHYMRRNAPYLSLEYVKQGSLFVRQRDSACELLPGEAFLMQPKLESEFLSGPSGCLKLSVMIVGRLLPALLRESGLADRDVLGGIDHHRLEQIFQALGGLVDQPRESGAPHNAVLTFELLQLLHAAPARNELPDDLAALCAEFHRRPEADWTLRRMAALCNCSTTHLTRRFRRCLATSPRQYLLQLRIRCAQRLLAEEELSIKEIADRVGYDNALNFSSEFRRRVGVSPRDYRKQLSFYA